MAIRNYLERDELDFGIVILLETSQTLQRLPMMTCHPVACVPENHPLSLRDSLSLHDLNGKDMILLKEGSFLRHYLLQKCQDNNIKPNIVLESNQVETIKGLISNGIGIGFLLDFNVENTPGIKTLPIEGIPPFEIGLAWKKDRYVSKAAQAFIDYCKESLVE